MMPPNGHPLIRPGVFRYRAGEIEPEHHHDEHQLVYVTYGLLTVEASTSRWLVPPLRALWVPAGIPHTIVSTVDSEMAALYVQPSLSLSGKAAISVISVSPLLRELIRHIHDHDPHGDRRTRIEAVLVDQLEATAPSAQLCLPKLHDPRTRAVAAALDHDPSDRRTLRQLGDAVGAHERTLQRLFVAETGTTFGRWRTQLRLQHGIVALTEGHTVSSAATLSGYREPSAFIAAFRAAYGTTPAAYLAGSDAHHAAS